MRGRRSGIVATLILSVLILALLAAVPVYAAPGTHVVRRGDTLSNISRRYGVSVSALARANGLRTTSWVYVGQRLTIPGSSSTSSASSSASGGIHVVRWGDTLSNISRRYGVSVSALAGANGLRTTSWVYTGQRLRIPGRSSGSSAPSTSAPTSGRWIEVDISSQRTIAWQGNSAVRSMVVSTGISRYPTPTGRFRIVSKYPSVAMSGPGYYLPGVPHTMYFYRGYAIHGTYWHNNFGRPMSHGCINLTRGDAAWLYSWAPIGTQVVIHW